VRDAIASGRFDAVAVELDEHRLVALTIRMRSRAWI